MFFEHVEKPYGQATKYVPEIGAMLSPLQGKLNPVQP
jgi:hypothetical protein